MPLQDANPTPSFGGFGLKDTSNHLDDSPSVVALKITSLSFDKLTTVRQPIFAGRGAPITSGHRGHGMPCPFLAATLALGQKARLDSPSAEGPK